MNHGPAFQALWTKLRTEVRELQSKGYYGDGQHESYFIFALTFFKRTRLSGYWSSGTRLVDSTRVSGQISSAGDLPEYMVCHFFHFVMYLIRLFQWTVRRCAHPRPSHFSPPTTEPPTCGPFKSHRCSDIEAAQGRLPRHGAGDIQGRRSSVERRCQ